MNRSENIPLDSARPAGNYTDPAQALTLALLEEKMAVMNADFGAPPQTEHGGVHRQATEAVTRPSPGALFAPHDNR